MMRIRDCIKDARQETARPHRGDTLAPKVGCDIELRD